MSRSIGAFLLFSLVSGGARAAAVCSLCAVMIASGLGLSKFFGVADCVLAIWLGAMLFAICQINSKLLDKWKIKNVYSVALGDSITYCLVLPLYAGEKPFLKFNERTILGIDEFLFSLALGTFVLFLSLRIYRIMKEKNGKPHFPFERVVLPTASLIVCSILINYLRS